MEQLNDIAFVQLFRAACEKCFGHPLIEPLSETDSKVLSNAMLEQTGLMVGAKSIKNYSIYVLSTGSERKENPSVATLDTLARYVMNAPSTNEIERKENAAHHPFWFSYKKQFFGTGHSKHLRKRARTGVSVIILAITVVIAAGLWWWLSSPRTSDITDDFSVLTTIDSEQRGWLLVNPDPTWWKRRSERAGHMRLFTLRGDNWPDESGAGIRNLVIRNIDDECFSAEVHLSDFFPNENWQQAGLLLAEDPSFTGKVLRLSISYNDFFGGFKKVPEIIIQGMSSAESGAKSKPEEFAHLNLFAVEASDATLVQKNLSHAALKIEKRDNHLRFLYSTGSMESFAFKEVTHRDFTIRPKYIALFAIQGSSPSEHPLPVDFDSFHYASIDCSE